jgi:hypothetical protein
MTPHDARFDLDTSVPMDLLMVMHEPARAHGECPTRFHKP